MTPQLHHTPTGALTKVEMARRLFREFYASCFWHLRPDLDFTEETIPLIIKGLRAHGGKQGWVAAAGLAKDAHCAADASSGNSSGP